MLSDVLARNAQLLHDFLDAQIKGTRQFDEAMRHALSGGKRLRGFLVIETARLHQVSPERAIFPAAAIEAMHAYSLVHDDMPCMDDDALRRGQPTVHG